LQRVSTRRTPSSSGCRSTAIVAFSAWLLGSTRSQIQQNIIYDNLRHVVLVLRFVKSRNIDSVLPPPVKGENPTIEAELSSDGKVVVKYNRKLLSRCTCVLRKRLARCNSWLKEEPEDRQGLIRYVESVEEFVFDYDVVWDKHSEQEPNYERFMRDVRECKTCREGSEWWTPPAEVPAAAEFP